MPILASGKKHCEKKKTRISPAYVQFVKVHGILIFFVYRKKLRILIKNKHLSGYILYQIYVYMVGCFVHEKESN
jgi:hypothetical protein